MSAPVRIAGLQTDIVWESPGDNFARLRPQIAAAKAAGADLVVLPEMYATGFSMQTDRIAELADGPSQAFIVEQAQQHHCWVCGSIPERAAADQRPFNTLVLAGPDGQTHRYRKIHPFSFAKEDEHYNAGREFLTVSVGPLRVTFFVCYDLRFADEFWTTAQQTDCYVVIANWPERRRHHWTTLLSARAIENQAYVVGVNRVGEGSGLTYTGDSRVIDPWGEVLASAARRPTMMLADVDPAVVAHARKSFPVFADRR